MYEMLSRFKSGKTSFEHLLPKSIQIKSSNSSYASFVDYPEKIKIKKDGKRWPYNKEEEKNNQSNERQEIQELENDKEDNKKKRNENLNKNFSSKKIQK
jgi:hypothetical protein